MANRLPRTCDAAGRWTPSAGGLVAALLPALHSRDATWIGGPDHGRADAPTAIDHVRLVSVDCDLDEHTAACDRFSNAALWPLYHDAIRPPIYDGSAWAAYERVNRAFADVTAAQAPRDALVWVHDYHLQLLPAMLRTMRPDLRIGYFHHVPFPHPDLFRQLPWREAIIDGLLGADLVGFQRPSDVAHFAESASCVDLSRVDGADGSVGLRVAGRTVDVRSYPVPADAAPFAARSRTAPVIERAAAIREACGSPKRVLLGVDRLDYTKGIDSRLQVIRSLLARGVLHAGRDTFIQVAVPSRDDAPGYAELRARVERLVGDINGEFGLLGNPVVHYLHRSLDPAELTAMYCAADIMLVTPYRDGMNLVAKEYVASRPDGTGRLILSEFAGAADQLKLAHLVNPHDTRSMESAITEALDAPPDVATMRRMRATVLAESPSAWASAFLSHLGSP